MQEPCTVPSFHYQINDSEKAHLAIYSSHANNTLGDRNNTQTRETRTRDSASLKRIHRQSRYNEFIDEFYREKLTSCLSLIQHSNRSTTLDKVGKLGQTKDSHLLELHKTRQQRSETHRQKIDEIERQSAQRLQEAQKSVELEIEQRRQRTESAIELEKKKREATDKELAEKSAAEEKKRETERESKLKKYMSPQGYKEYEKSLEPILNYEANIAPKLKSNVIEKRMVSQLRSLGRYCNQIGGDYIQKVKAFKIEVEGTAAQPGLLNRTACTEEQYNILYPAMLYKLSHLIVRQVYTAGTNFTQNNVDKNISGFVLQLTQLFPELIHYLMGSLFRECPYLIPKFVIQDPSPSESAEYFKGKSPLPKENESRDLYHYLCVKTTDQNFRNVQAAYVQFFATLCITLHGMPNAPYSLRHCWIWLARICNITPFPMSPHLIHSFLDIAAASMHQVYGRQFRKTMLLIKEQLIPIMNSDPERVMGDMSRLSNALDNYFSKGVYKQ